MSECSDRRFEKMIYAYELGLLSDEERQQFELHQMECDHCFQRVKQFTEAARLIELDSEVRESIHRMAAETAPEEPETRPTTRRWIALVPASLAAAAVLIILLLKPFSVEFKPTQDAIALEQRLAVMYFNNLAEPGDSGKLGEIASSLLITDLSESRYVRVVSSQYLYDILRSIDMEDMRAIDREVAKRIAQRARARWILMGDILQVEPHFVITSQLVDVSSGDVLASQHVEGDADESIFSIVDRLTVEVKSDLSLPSQATSEADPDVADVTTHSPDAYRLYLEAIDLYHKYYLAEASRKLKQALEFDSTFAMAYYYLAQVEDVSFARMALKYLDRASRREQYYILSVNASISGNLNASIEELSQLIEQYPDEKEAYFMLGNRYRQLGELQKSIVYYEKTLSIDSLYKLALNMLAYSYNAVGDFDKAIAAIDRYIALAPDEANPYDSKGDILAEQGRIDDAIESYKRALRVKPDYIHSLRKLGFMYLYAMEFDSADSCFNEMTFAEGWLGRVGGRYFRCYTPVYQGDFDEALRMIDRGIEETRADGVEYDMPSFHHLKALIYYERGDLSAAVTEARRTVEAEHAFFPENPVFSRHFFCHILAESGNLQEAEKVANELRADLEATDYTLASYWYCNGNVGLAEGNVDEALRLFKKAVDESPTFTYSIEYMLARAYLMAEQFDEAAMGFEELVNSLSETRHYWTTWSVNSHYYLALAYDKSGRSDLAIEQYEKFLEFWGDADLEEVVHARERVAQLQS